METAEAPVRKRLASEAQAALAVWRERLPEVWPAVPVVRPPQLGAGQTLVVAVLAGVLWGLILAVGDWAATWAIEELALGTAGLFPSATVAKIVEGLLRFVLYISLLVLFFSRIVLMFPRFYIRHLLPRSPSRRAAGWGGFMASLISFLCFNLAEWASADAFPEWISGAMLPAMPTDFSSVLS